VRAGNLGGTAGRHDTGSSQSPSIQDEFTDEPFMQQKKRFSDVTSRVSFPDLEVELLETWRREGTYARSLALREGGPRFVFY